MGRDLILILVPNLRRGKASSPTACRTSRRRWVVAMTPWRRFLLGQARVRGRLAGLTARQLLPITRNPTLEMRDVGRWGDRMV